MNMTPKTGLILAIAAILPTCGCSTTPQAALDQANNGTYLMLAMQGEIQKFRAEEATISRLRVDALLQARLDLERKANIRADDDRLYAAAGKTAISANMPKIIALADARAKDDMALNATEEEINKSIAELLSPLPDMTKELENSKKSLAILGDDLSPAERLRIFANFAKDVKGSVDANMKKVEDAKQAAGAPKGN
jgi:hypothetical protein